MLRKLYAEFVIDVFLLANRFPDLLLLQPACTSAVVRA
jgi:hypothetical protein